MLVVWPEIFLEKGFQYSIQGEERKTLAAADGLMGWALCMSGNKPPENFGYGMVEISKILGITPSPESLMEYSKGLENVN